MASSIRTVYLPETVSKALQEMKVRREEEKALMGTAYTDYSLVLAHEDGRPYEERQIANLIRKSNQMHAPSPIVFRSPRHCSASMKLQLSGGDTKAVQGDTGPAQAQMVTDLYAHTSNEDRRQLTKKVEQKFFRNETDKTKEKAAADEAQKAYQLLPEKPGMAKLILAMMEQNAP